MAYSSFIDSSYFIGEINYPNIADNATMLTSAINKYEKEILISLLGYKLYSLLIADCTSEGGLPATQIYIDLVNGAEFTHASMTGNDILLKWEGLRNATTKESLIAYFCYYKIIERETTHLTSIGNSLLDGEGSTRVSPMDKMINAWDRMRNLAGKMPPQYQQYYGDFSRPGTDFGITNDEPSLYNFLYANSANYPDWYFKPIWSINHFGI